MKYLVLLNINDNDLNAQERGVVQHPLGVVSKTKANIDMLPLS